MNKICLIYQPAGLGDIFYSIGIATYFRDKGYRVVWPVVEEILDTVKQIPNIEFYDWNDNFPRKEHFNKDSLEVISTEDFVFLPIHRSTEILGGLVMPSKYRLAGVDPKIWKSNFNWVRNVKKENELYSNVLCLSDSEEYVLVNQNFVTPPRTVKFPMSLQTEDKLINMNYIEGFNVFDWAKVIEKARGIVTVDTCIQYMIENLNCQSEFYFCYPRNGSNTVRQIREIYNTPWTYLDTNNSTLEN